MPGIERKPSRSYDEIPFRREWGCPQTKNRTPWCFGLCIPQDGLGACGRIAPHSLIGRTERAILRYKAVQAAAATALPNGRLDNSKLENGEAERATE